MKLRLKGNSIRFRLTQTEVNALAAGESIYSTLRISAVQEFVYALEPWNLNVFQVKMENGEFTVFVPSGQIGPWASGDAEGISGSQDNGSDEPLSISIEKDFVCLKDRPGENEDDHFPHPDAGARTC
jgi:hypothetical protein